MSYWELKFYVFSIQFEDYKLIELLVVKLL